MGLDMYLHKRTYVKNWEHMKAQERHQVIVKKNGVTVPKNRIDPDKVIYIIEEAGYWRKANAIHKWFVDNVQRGNDDCKEYYVDQEELQELLDLVNQVLADHSKAAKLLPTGEGFFFGSYEYDIYYFENLESTKEILQIALKDKDGEYEYRSSW